MGDRLGKGVEERAGEVFKGNYVLSVAVTRGAVRQGLRRANEFEVALKD